MCINTAIHDAQQSLPCTSQGFVITDRRRSLCDSAQTRIATHTDVCVHLRSAEPRTRRRDASSQDVNHTHVPRAKHSASQTTEARVVNTMETFEYMYMYSANTFIRVVLVDQLRNTKELGANQPGRPAQPDPRTPERRSQRRQTVFVHFEGVVRTESKFIALLARFRRRVQIAAFLAETRDAARLTGSARESSRSDSHWGRHARRPCTSQRTLRSERSQQGLRLCASLWVLRPCAHGAVSWMGRYFFERRKFRPCADWQSNDPTTLNAETTPHPVHSSPLPSSASPLNN